MGGCFERKNLGFQLTLPKSTEAISRCPSVCEHYPWLWTYKPTDGVPSLFISGWHTPKNWSCENRQITVFAAVHFRKPSADQIKTFRRSIKHIFLESTYNSLFSPIFGKTITPEFRERAISTWRWRFLGALFACFWCFHLFFAVRLFLVVLRVEERFFGKIFFVGCVLL